MPNRFFSMATVLAVAIGLAACNSATTGGAQSGVQKASLTPQQQAAEAENCSKYAGTYTLKMAEWSDGTVTITCVNGRSTVTDIKIGNHDIQRAEVELNGNELKLDMRIDGRSVSTDVSGDPANMTGRSSFEYRRGNGFGGGRSSMQKIS